MKYTEVHIHFMSMVFWIPRPISISLQIIRVKAVAHIMHKIPRSECGPFRPQNKNTLPGLYLAIDFYLLENTKYSILD